MQIIREITKKAPYYLTHLIAFTLPLSAKLVSLFVILFFISVLFAGNYQKGFYKTIKRPIIYLPLILYCFYFISVFFSENKQVAWFDLQVKLSLLLFPVFVCLHQDFREYDYKKILISFVEGCIAACTVALFLASVKYYFSFESDNFFYTSLSYALHPSYLAMYIVFSIAILLYLFDLNSFDIKVSFLGNKLIRLFIYLFFSVVVVMLSSKSGMLSIALLIAFALLYLMFVKRKILLSSVSILFIALSIILLPKIAPYPYSRLKAAFSAVENAENSKNENGEGTGERMMIWKTSHTLIYEHPFGVGVGDVKTVLMAEYKNTGMLIAAKKHLNCHNQYLQTGLAIGIPGLLLFAGMLFFPIYTSLKKMEYLFTAFILLVSFNFLFESMFETQAGVIFYAFFYSLFAVRYLPQLKKQ
jgi:O-antigen ligase